MTVEPMEGRLLLSTTPVAPATTKPTAHELAVEARTAARQKRQAALAAAKQAQASTVSVVSIAPKVVQGATNAVNDAWNGYWLVHSKNVAKVGLNFAKVTVSHDTRKVAAAYIAAALAGNGKTLAQLGHTNVVKEVGNDFSKLSTSPGVTYVGKQFSDFGKSVAKQFSKLF